MSQEVKLVYITDQRLPRNSTDSHQFMAMVSHFGKIGLQTTLLSIKSLFERGSSPKVLADYFSIPESFSVDFVNAQFFGLRFIEKFLAGLFAIFNREVRQASIVYSRNLNIIFPIVFFTGKQVFMETYKTMPDNSILLKFWLILLKKKKNFCGIITHSGFASNSYKRIGYDDHRLLVKHNSVRSLILENVMSKSEARQKLGLDSDKFIVTYSGATTLEKGLDLILETASLLPDVQFQMIGSVGRGPFEKLAENHENIHIVNWMHETELLPYLYATDCLIIPPSDKPLKKVKNTVLPIKTFIYMAVERPIIAPNNPDIVELLKNGQNAILVEPNNVEQFKEAILYLKDHPDFAREIASAAHLQIKNNTWEERAKAIRDFCLERI